MYADDEEKAWDRPVNCTHYKKPLLIVEQYSVVSVRQGWCFPRMLLLQRNPDPSEAEVRDALSGNLCRCTAMSNRFRRFCERRLFCVVSLSRRLSRPGSTENYKSWDPGRSPLEHAEHGAGGADDEEGGTARSGRGNDTPATDGDGANGGGIATLVGTRAAVDLNIVGKPERKVDAIKLVTGKPALCG